MASKRKSLKQEGKGKSEPLTHEEELKLAEKYLIGISSPKKLLNKIWLINTKLTGFRGNVENQKLRWGIYTVTLKLDQGGEFLEFNERDTKNRSGADSNSHLRAFDPKQFATPSDPMNCPVNAYKVYRDHPPPPNRHTHNVPLQIAHFI